MTGRATSNRERIEAARETLAEDQFDRVEKALSALVAAIDAAIWAGGRTVPEVVLTRPEFERLSRMPMDVNDLIHRVHERHEAWLDE